MEATTFEIYFSQFNDKYNVGLPRPCLRHGYFLSWRLKHYWNSEKMLFISSIEQNKIHQDYRSYER